MQQIGHTALIRAVEGNTLDTATLLLEFGADVNQRDRIVPLLLW